MASVTSSFACAEARATAGWCAASPDRCCRRSSRRRPSCRRADRAASSPPAATRRPRLRPGCASSAARGGRLRASSSSVSVTIVVELAASGCRTGDRTSRASPCLRRTCRPCRRRRAVPVRHERANASARSACTPITCARLPSPVRTMTAAARAAAAADRHQDHVGVRLRLEDLERVGARRRRSAAARWPNGRSAARRSCWSCSTRSRASSKSGRTRSARRRARASRRSFPGCCPSGTTMVHGTPSRRHASAIDCP